MHIYNSTKSEGMIDVHPGALKTAKLVVIKVRCNIYSELHLKTGMLDPIFSASAVLIYLFPTPHPFANDKQLFVSIARILCALRTLHTCIRL